MQNHGYALTIKQSYPSLQQVCYCCDRGSYRIRTSEPLSHVLEDQRKRKRVVFRLNANMKRVYGWLVTEL